MGLPCGGIAGSLSSSRGRSRGESSAGLTDLLSIPDSRHVSLHLHQINKNKQVNKQLPNGHVAHVRESLPVCVCVF